MMDEAYQRAKDILEKYLPKLHAVAEALMLKETLEAEEFYKLMREQPDGAGEDDTPNV
jgi:cell division protease FtsH